jgi:CHAT domain-containing protein/Tfp pilus assembly protein PilF
VWANLKEAFMNKAVVFLCTSLLIVVCLSDLHAESNDKAIELYKKGDIAYSRSIYDEALKYYGESLKICIENKISQGIASNNLQIGIIKAAYGQYDKALFFFEQALSVNREMDNQKGIAQCFERLGGVYYSKGEYDRAQMYFEEAIKINNNDNLQESISNCYNYLGLINFSLGRYNEALSKYSTSLTICKKVGLQRDIATLNNNIGLVYCAMNRYDDAKKYLNDSLDTSRKYNHAETTATTLDNLGFLCLAENDYARAEEMFIKAEKEFKKTGIERKGNSGLVHVYNATKRYKDALKLLTEMEPDLYSPDSYKIQFHSAKGFSLLGDQDYSKASHELLISVRTSEQMRQHVRQKMGFFESGYAGGRIRSYQGLVEALAERALRQDIHDAEFRKYGKDLASSAFYFSESIKARTLLESIAEAQRNKKTLKLEADLKAKEQRLLDELSAIDQQRDIACVEGEESYRELQKKKDRSMADLDELIATIRSKYPSYANLYYPEPVVPERLSLKKNEVLLEYVLCENAGYIFIVKEGGLQPIIKIKKSKKEIEQLVSSFIKPLQSQYTINDFSISKGVELYRLLLEEALKDIPRDHHIIIVPDGILGLLPFESMVAIKGEKIEDTKYIGDLWGITYSQSASVLDLNRRAPYTPAQKLLFALGNPIFNDKDPRYIAYKKGQKYNMLLAQNTNDTAFRALATRREWGKTSDDDTGDKLAYIPLPETEDEVKEIAKILNVEPSPPDILLNIFANESSFRKTTLKNYRYLHFATHADLPGRVQGIKEPFILLGQVENKGTDDGFLTLSEVLDLDLNADMVVLSACMTGRGNVVEGEGVVNFARAFQYAGSKSVVVSLWEVGSKETVDYMTTFYRHLHDGKSKDEALRLTRTEMKKKNPNPFFWAPFILHGEG